MDLVALLTESVDRNSHAPRRLTLHYVALLTESVDRNLLSVAHLCSLLASLSSRRAWIEIEVQSLADIVNESLSSRRAWIEIRHALQSQRLHRSLSSRRAWIEMCLAWYRAAPLCVALLTESVDRNAKFLFSANADYVALLTESVDRNLYAALQ